jgi:uncharacterized protein (DUF2236 family)
MGQEQQRSSPEFNVQDVVAGAGMLAATANVIMQLSRPEVAYGVLESTVVTAQVIRHPVRRWWSTVTFLAVALMGEPAERAAYRRLIDRSHAQVRSTRDSPVRYSAFDPELQLWVAACLYQGMSDMHAMLYGQADDRTADAIYRVASRFGTTLQVPEQMWPPDRMAFQDYWEAALTKIRLDPAVRHYLDQLIMLRYLPRPFSVTLSPFNRFITTGFLRTPFRELMQLSWSERDQQAFLSLMRLVAVINHFLPAPARRFPFNVCLLVLRARERSDRAQDPNVRHHGASAT